MFVLRDLLEKIKPFLKRKEYIAITGPRQSGKTTFLKILKDYVINKERIDKELIHTVTFEDRKQLKQFEDDPVSFVQSYQLTKHTKTTTYLMLDEFQYIKEGGQKLKLVYDTVENIKIVVTGSSALEIKSEVGKYMVGRILTFYMFPFNFQEYLRSINSRLEKIYQERHKIIVNWFFTNTFLQKNEGEDTFYDEMIRQYEKYCIWGGYPSVVLSKTDSERLKILGDMYNSYVLKDVKGLLELSTDRNLFLLSQYLSTQVGNIIVYNNLSQISMLDFRQLKRHLNILKETFICTALSPFFINRQKELSKNPKVFFFDLGFRNYLIENMNSLEKRSDRGAVVENIVFIRLNEIWQDKGKINFWRTKSGAEVDFVVQYKGEIIPIEVKYTRYESRKFSKSFVSFIKSFEPKRALVLTQNYWGIARINKTSILFAPVYYL